jgi:uncharacterized protein
LTPISRRQFLKTGAGIGAAGAFVLGADAWFYEPNHPVVLSREIWISRLPEAWDGVRIAQISDFHYDDHFSVVPIGKSVGMVNALRPDLILLTGDFVTVPPFASRFHTARRAAAAAEPCAALLSGLHAPYGVWAILGNHDCFADPWRITETLQHHGFHVLRNAASSFERQGSRLWLAGLDDVLEGQPDIDKTLAGIPPHEAVVLLVHEPDFAPYAAEYPVDLQLSGHSHGGQVRLPLVGAPFLPDMGRKFPMGMYQVGSLILYTNVGIGTIRVPVRLNCPPEITLITLRRRTT